MYSHKMCGRVRRREHSSGYCMYVFFFEQKTAYDMRISDWSSDVCSSDLGWVFFAIVIALVMAAGWPLFDRRADEAFFDPAKLKGAVRHGGQAAVIAPLLIVIAAIAPLWTGAVAATSDPVPNHISLPADPGCDRKSDG